MSADGNDPLLAVVIPVYCQGQYLADAVLSATRQTVGPSRVVVVDDGCPTDITRREARWLADAFPETVTYLRTSNRGVAHARNFGARFALEAWPTVQAICFLDADDRLSSHSLDSLWKALDRSPTSVGWAYANLEYFGDRLGAWNIPRPFSRFRELFENQSGMGCLVHRRVFDAGLYFEGDTTASYEDWEFFIRAMQLGFSGVHTGSIGVRYRVRGNSRLAECLANYDDLYAQMSKRNWATFDPRERTRREHDELPRFALVSLDKARVWLFTNPLAPRRAYISLDELARRYSRYLDEYPDSATYVAPIVILAAAPVEEWLSSSPLAPGILFRIQHLLRTHRVVTIADRQQTPFAALELSTDGDDRDTPALLAATFWDVIDAQSDAPGATERELRAALVGGRDFVPPEERHVDYEQTHSEFALRLAHSEQTTFPWTPEDGVGRDVFFVVPTLDGLNGAELRVLRLAQAMTELGGDERLHLVVTDSTQLPVAEAALAPFTTVTSLASISLPERESALLVVLGSADIVIDAGSGPLRSILPRLRRAGTGSYVGIVHGPGELESTLSAYGACTDHFLVSNERLGRACINRGASPDQIVLAPNATDLSPTSFDEAERIARQKSARRDVGDPLRILFVGESNADTGFDRLAHIGACLEQLGVCFELQVIERSSRECSGLVEAYLWADVYVQPSRREEAPIRMLDAMAFGCVVIATDVGEVADVVEHANNGFLVPSEIEESHLTQLFANQVHAMAGDSAGSAQVRHAALATAFRSTWSASSSAVLRALGTNCD